VTDGALATRPPHVAIPNRVLVLWQSQPSRRYHHVGELTRDSDGYHFRYLPRAQSLAGFEPFANFPDLDREYSSDAPFPMFANRVMTPLRDSYDAYIASLGLGHTQPEPFEVLARTSGTRMSDVVQLLPVPRMDEHGLLSLFFLVQGARHVDPNGLHLAEVSPGDELFVACEPDNPASTVAVLVGRSRSPRRETALGYVPQVFAPLVSALIAAEAPLRVTAEHVTHAAGGAALDHMRPLARFDAIAPPHFDIDSALDS